TTQVPVRVLVADAQGYPVADGTLVEVAVAEGRIAPAPVTAAAIAGEQVTVETLNGRADLYFTPPSIESSVAATATVSSAAGIYSDTIMLHVRNPAPDTVTLRITPD